MSQLQVKKLAKRRVASLLPLNVQMQGLLSFLKLQVLPLEAFTAHFEFRFLMAGKKLSILKV